MEYSLLQGINLTLKYLPYPFEPSPSPPKKKQKILNLPDLPFMSNPPQNFAGIVSPLEMYPRPRKETLIF